MIWAQEWQEKWALPRNQARWSISSSTLHPYPTSNLRVSYLLGEIYWFRDLTNKRIISLPLLVCSFATSPPHSQGIIISKGTVNEENVIKWTNKWTVGKRMKRSARHVHLVHFIYFSLFASLIKDHLWTLPQRIDWPLERNWQGIVPNAQDFNGDTMVYFTCNFISHSN